MRNKKQTNNNQTERTNMKKGIALLQKILSEQTKTKVGLFETLAFAKQNAKDLPTGLQKDVDDMMKELTNYLYQQYKNNNQKGVA